MPLSHQVIKCISRDIAMRPLSGTYPHTGEQPTPLRERRKGIHNRHTRLTCRRGGTFRVHNRCIPKHQLNLYTTEKTRSDPGLLL
ncbi:hypothetical protein HanIR_Chr15g0740091 [Helianthus annuus]|nr:hypothetical protein HanIR_Chr15g0740091 [Helianthus annuus]